MKIRKKLSDLKGTKLKIKRPLKTKLSGRFLKGKRRPLPKKPTVALSQLPPNSRVIERYYTQKPYARAVILSKPELGGAKAYHLEEVELSAKERDTLTRLVDILGKELEPPKEDVNPKSYVLNEARRLAKKYRPAGKLDEESWGKVLYYIERDLLGFGKIHGLINDPAIEDISLNGLGIPVYVWHRKYESMPTNLTFTEEKALDNLIIKLTHLGGKHVSTAFPLLDAMLPGKHRLSATFRKEVSPKGSSFTIRKFREEPFSIIDLINLGTIDDRIAAYLWLLIENRMTVVVIGGTGAGKTSCLNALASLVLPSMKIVTVEEIPELNLPHENWVQMVSRESYGLGVSTAGEVPLFRLVKTSLRYRPDYIVVGEIRGEEAFVLFQAMATGHGGMCTLHAENLDYAVKRLTSPPMNVSEAYIPLINVAAVVERVQLPKRSRGITFGRRIRSLMEVQDFGKYRTVATWNPLTDRFSVNLNHSLLLKKIRLRLGRSQKEMLSEFEHRALVLRRMKRAHITKNVDVARRIANHHIKPRRRRARS